MASFHIAQHVPASMGAIAADRLAAARAIIDYANDGGYVHLGRLAEQLTFTLTNQTLPSMGFWLPSRPARRCRDHGIHDPSQAGGQRT